MIILVKKNTEKMEEIVKKKLQFHATEKRKSSTADVLNNVFIILNKAHYYSSNQCRLALICL